MMGKLEQVVRSFRRLWAPSTSSRHLQISVVPGCNSDAVDCFNLLIRSVKEIHDLVFNSKKLLLNKMQCENLSSKLLTTVHNIQELMNFVSSPQSGASISTAFKPALENLYRISEKAKSLVTCCSEEDWCEASAFQVQNEEAFKDILLDVGLGYNVIYDQANRMIEERNFHTLPKNLCPDPVAISLVDMEKVCKDQQMLQQALEDQVGNKQRVSSSINPRQQHLARYLLGKLKSLRQQGQLMEDLDMSGEILWVTDVEPPGTWGNLDVIGSGSGATCVGKSTWLGIPCAKKIFTAGVNEATFVNETRILVRLNHPNVVKFFCCGNDRKGHYFIAMEIMDTSLSAIIESRAQNRQPLFLPIVALDIIVQIARGICYLHDLGIAHRDLKPSNVVINKVSNIPHLADTYNVKLIDFGMSRTKVEVSKSNTITVPNTGTTRYRAPEVFRNAQQEGDRGRVIWMRADVYSFGIACAEILSLKEAFHGIPQTGLYNELVTGTRPPLPPGAYPEKLVALVKDCWHGRPGSRPSFLQICNRLEEVRYDLLMGIPSTSAQRTLQQVRIDSSTSNDYIKMMFKNCSETRGTHLIKHVDEVID